MKPNQIPTQDELRELLDYRPRLGLLLWKGRRLEMFGGEGLSQASAWKTFNTRFAGRPALHGIDRSSGYRRGAIYGVHFLAHRIIWKIVTGEDPIEVDHINGDRADNKWDNLRNVTLQENCRNRGRRCDNISGQPGVTWDKKCAMWRVHLNDVYLGGYDNLDMAIEIRKRAEACADFHPNHGKRPAWRRAA